MEIEIKTTCPLGHECERAVGEHIERCAWYTKLVGKDPQSKKDYDEWGCAIAWMPILSTEIAQTNRGQTAAIESFRNEMVVQQPQVKLIQKEERLVKHEIEEAPQGNAEETGFHPLKRLSRRARKHKGNE